MKVCFLPIFAVFLGLFACETPPPPVTGDTPVIDAAHPTAYYTSDSSFYSVYQPDDNFYDLIVQAYTTPRAGSLNPAPSRALFFKRTTDAYVDYFGDSTGLLLPAPLAREQEVRGDIAGRTEVLTPVAPAVPITWLTFADSARYDTSATAATYDLSFRLPQAASGSETLNALINGQMREHAFGNGEIFEGNTLQAQLAAMSEKEKEDFFTQDVPDELRNFGSSYSRSNSEKGFVRYNYDNLLTLEMAGYTYAGGAHGNYGSSFYNYQVDPPKQLTLADYVPMNKRTQLGAVLTQIANRPDAEGNKISDRFYETGDVVAVTENVAVFPDGLLFHYPPYELGPYAAGAIDIFVPKSELPR